MSTAFIGLDLAKSVFQVHGVVGSLLELMERFCQL
ncbi:hypothetical protein GGE65_008350 [Skermanella aerolata]